MRTQSKKKTADNIGNTSSASQAKNLELEADVLFQRLYGKWYAFTVVEEDCLMTEVTEEEVKQRMSRRPLPRAA